MSDPRHQIDKLVTGVICLYPYREIDHDAVLRMVVLKSRDCTAPAKTYYIRREGGKIVAVPEAEAKKIEGKKNV